MNRAEIETFIKLKYNLRYKDGILLAEKVPHDLKNELYEKHQYEYSLKFPNGTSLMPQEELDANVSALMSSWNNLLMNALIEYEQQRRT